MAPWGRSQRTESSGLNAKPMIDVGAWSHFFFLKDAAQEDGLARQRKPGIKRTLGCVSGSKAAKGEAVL